MLACLIDGCVLPQGELTRLVLWAIVVGICAGIMLSTVLSKLLDLALMLVERRQRIEDARNRDHSKVPCIRGCAAAFDRFQGRLAERVIGPL